MLPIHNFARDLRLLFDTGNEQSADSWDIPVFINIHLSPALG